MKRLLALGLFLMILAPAASAETPDLTGEWVLDEALSDDLAAVMAKFQPDREARSSGGMKNSGMKDGRLVVTRIMTPPTGGDPVPVRFVSKRES